MIDVVLYYTRIWPLCLQWLTVKYASEHTLSFQETFGLTLFCTVKESIPDSIISLAAADISVDQSQEVALAMYILAIQETHHMNIEGTMICIQLK